ncbi:MAG: single-stranded-DNA-specific exonuclease RecJ, partial [Christensenellales bacterium]
MLVFRPRDVEDSAALCDADGVSPLMRQLLAQRGIVTRAQADAFLHPSVSQLHDPMLMQNMSKVCARICEALEKRERICVYGDYDVDGVTSASIMSGYLRSLGGDVRVYIP